MGEKEIKDKLIEKLVSVPKTEEDIVYVLSRIIKILEINNKPENYSILNFYCNLTLHAQITRPPKIIIEKLKKYHKKADHSMIFEITSGDFHDQLDKFLKEHSIPSFYPIKPEDLKALDDLLLSVWSHTPIRIEYVEAFDISFKKNIEGGLTVSVKPIK